MAADLGITASQAQLTLTACMIGLALGQVVAGPLSDSLGRKRPLLVGLCAFAVFSLMCATAGNIWLLIGYRFVQGLGGAAGIVIARAVIRDRFSGEALVRTYTTILAVLGVAPIVAPIAGGLLLNVTSWRGIFVALCVVGLLLLTGALLLAESLPPGGRREAGRAALIRDFGAVFQDRQFRLGAGVAALASTALFAYIAGSSFVLQERYDFSPQTFSLFFALCGAGFVTFSQLNRLLMRWFTTIQRLRMAVGILVLGGASITVAALLPTHPVQLVIAAFFGCAAGYGLASPNAVAISMQNHSARAGSASALQGLLQFSCGAAVAPVTGIAGASLVPITLAIAVPGVLAALVLARMGSSATV